MTKIDANRLPERNPAGSRPGNDDPLIMATIVQLLREVKARRDQENAGQSDAAEADVLAPE